MNAVFGWSGHAMAALYTRAADRKKLAARAMAKWARPDDAVLQPELAFLRIERERV